MDAAFGFNKQQRKVLFLSSLGGVLEFYDFIIYIFLTPFIEKVFFAQNDTYLATLKTLAIFSIGYFVRPFGGIVFAHFGDRYGRKVVFLLTVLFMAIPSFAIGILPTPAQIGWMSPILLLVFRLMQGLSLGGEIPAAITFLYEHFINKRKGLAIAILFFGLNAGILLGSLITALLTSYLSAQQMLDYGWRIPFIIGGLFGFISLYLRRYLQETQAFKALNKETIAKIPLFELMRVAPWRVVQGVFLVALGSISIFFFLYWPQYLSQYMQYNFNQLMHLNTACTLFLSFTVILGGLLADKFGYQKMYFYGAVSMALLAYPLFLLFTLKNMIAATLSYILFSIIFGLLPCGYAIMLCEAFPTAIRYSGISLSYNLAYAIFGGLSPIICTVAIHTFNNILAPAYYMIAVAIIASIASLSNKTNC